MSQETKEQPLPPHAQVVQMASGYWISRAIYVAAKLGVADLLKDGARDASDLARETKTHPGALYRLLRTLASLGFFKEVKSGRFENAELGSVLRDDDPGKVRATVLMLGSDAAWGAWGELPHSVETGASGISKSTGMGIFDYYRQNPEEARYFNDAMIGIHGAEPAAVAKVFDPSGIRKLVDVGGGTGNLLTTILQTHTDLEGVLYDLPHVAQEAEQRIAGLGLKKRCRVLSGSFFDAVPPGDSYTLSHIIHDWDEASCLKILGHCKRANPEATVQIIEMVIPEGGEPHFGKILDMAMLALTEGGQERTEAEYAALYEKAGYKLNRVIPTESPVSIIEGVPG